MKKTNWVTPRPEFLKLHLIEIMDFIPTPSKEHLGGRFIKSALSAGCPGQVSVRARMITAISETKFKTTDEAPVSLVSLHGKDDLLVLGPADAIERLASGEVPKSLNESQIYKQKLQEAIAVTKQELTYLSRLSSLFNVANMNDAKDEGNKELRMFFRSPIEQVINYFEENSLEDFVDQFSVEATAHLAHLQQLLEVELVYPRWWIEWEDFGLTAPGRHVTAYPISEKKLVELRPRNDKFQLLSQANVSIPELEKRA